MASPQVDITCPACGQPNPRDATYCQRCGEPVNARLVGELQRLYSTLTLLDDRIAAGDGELSVATLRDNLRAQYEAKRSRKPASAPAATAGAAGAAQSARATIPLAQPAPVSTQVSTPSPAATTMPQAQRPAAGPVFSWSAFIAEQAIAVMAYLGGFLLLIATLTFEVGGWQALPNGLKLVGVIVVYLIFAVLGFALRQVGSLRTVGRVYLGVFALMTPLVALAVYRFELQSQGFPAAGMVCVGAAYATVVYLALAIRTRFTTYAYLAWAALLVAALAVPLWAGASNAWLFTAAEAAALIMLAPLALRSRLRARQIVSPAVSQGLAVVTPPAAELSALTAVLSMAAVWLWAVGVLLQALFSSVPQTRLAETALVVGACVSVPLALAWAYAARQFQRRPDDALLSFLDWTPFLGLGLAAALVAMSVSADRTVLSLTLTLAALIVGIVAEGAGQYRPARRGLRVALQVLAATYGALAVFFALPDTPGDTALIAASVAGMMLCLVFALRSTRRGVITWGLVAGAFALQCAHASFLSAVPAARLTSIADVYPAALVEQPTLNVFLALGLWLLGLGLKVAPRTGRARTLRISIYVTALAAAADALLLMNQHTAPFIAALAGVLAAATWLAGRLEGRAEPAGGIAAFFGLIAALAFISNNANGALVATFPLWLAALALVIRRTQGRAYALPVYALTLVSTLAAYVQLSAYQSGSLYGIAALQVSVPVWVALGVAALLTVAALWEGTPGWMAGPAAVVALGAGAGRLGPLVALTVSVAAVSIGLRRWRGPGWGAAWEVAAAIISLWAMQAAATSTTPGASWRLLAIALGFALLAWLIAWFEQLPALTFALAPYAWFALIAPASLPVSLINKLFVSLGVAVALAVAGLLVRARFGRWWAPALYLMATVGVWLIRMRLAAYPDQAGLLEGALLLFAGLAFIAALLEDTPWAAMAPALFAAVAALSQPDPHALLPLAIGLAAASFAVSRLRGGWWAIALYGAALVSGVAAAWRTQGDPGFEALTLAALALVIWVMASLESRPDALPLAYLFAALAVAPATQWLGWPAWAPTLTFAALAWAFEATGEVWRRLPWLRVRSGGARSVLTQLDTWLAARPPTADTPAPSEAPTDPRALGQRVARLAAGLTALAAVVGGLFAPGAFDTHAAQTQALAVALLSLAALLAYFDLRAQWWPGRYLAIEALALCVSWELRWLGAENAQAWILAPGSAQIIIGALLPADHRARVGRWLPQALSIAGALILTLPTLWQSATEPVEWQWRYALLLAVEALALTLIAVGLRNRLLALTGSAFVGVAAIRGAIIAVQQNLPVPVVIAIFALALMGLATWLSLRARRHAAPVGVGVGFPPPDGEGGSGGAGGG